MTAKDLDNLRRDLQDLSIAMRREHVFIPDEHHFGGWPVDVILARAAFVVQQHAIDVAAREARQRQPKLIPRSRRVRA